VRLLLLLKMNKTSTRKRKAQPRRVSSAKPGFRRLSLVLSDPQFRRLKAGAKFFGFTSAEICIAGCLNMLDMGGDSVRAVKQSTAHLVKAYARKRVAFYRPEDGTEYPVQASR
jgi:hypothetical protein